MPYASIDASEDDVETEEAKKLEEFFSHSKAWWYELTLTRKEPIDNPMRVKVSLMSSRYDPESVIWGGKDLGQWWISDLKEAKGDSLSAIEMVHKYLF